MNERIVINTGPLLALGKMNAFDLIEQLPYDFFCPSQVEAEILNGQKLGYPVGRPEWVRVLELQSSLTPFATIALDDGEASVIQLALELNISIVCLDELKGRRAASSMGLRVIGSLGLLGKSKTEGLIVAVRPFIEEAQRNGVYYQPDLVEVFLRAIGE